MDEEVIVKIKDFITNNRLDFSGSGSDLNGNCVILCGYLLHIEKDIKDLLVTEVFINFPSEVDDELYRVFEFAEANNYGAWWKSPEAKKMYKF